MKLPQLSIIESRDRIIDAGETERLNIFHN
jgi:hypothetical protein